jgi:ABC-type multidrug transport system permease subunit
MDDDWSRTPITTSGGVGPRRDSADASDNDGDVDTDSDMNAGGKCGRGSRRPDSSSTEPFEAPGCDAASGAAEGSAVRKRCKARAGRKYGREGRKVGNGPLEVVLADSTGEGGADTYSPTEALLFADNFSLFPPPGAVRDSSKFLDRQLARRRRPNALQQVRLLAARSWRNYMRDPMNTYVRMAQICLFALFAGLVFINLTNDDAGVQDRQGALYFVTIQTAMLNMFPALLSFPPERAIFLQDMTNDLYSPFLYYWSKVVVEFPLHLITPTLFSVIYYFMLHLVRTAEQFFIFWFVLWVNGYTGQALGMLLSATFSNANSALAVGPLIVMPLSIVSGLFANTKRLEPGWVWLTYLSFMRYTFKSLIRNEFLHLPSLAGPRYADGQAVIRALGFTKTSDKWGINTVINLGIMAVLRIAGSIMLWVHARRQQATLPFLENYDDMMDADEADGGSAAAAGNAMALAAAAGSGANAGFGTWRPLGRRGDSNVAGGTGEGGADAGGRKAGGGGLSLRRVFAGSLVPQGPVTGPGSAGGTASGRPQVVPLGTPLDDFRARIDATAGLFPGPTNRPSINSAAPAAGGVG